MAARVHAHLPRRLADHLAASHSGAEVVDAGDRGWVDAAAAAAEDPDCVAFVGPMLSWQVAEVAALLNEHGIAHVVPAATYGPLTREEPGAEEGMPESLCPTGRRTLLRIAPRELVVCEALVAAEPGPHCLLGDGTPYAERIGSLLRLAGAVEDPAAASAVFTGMAPGVPDEATLAFEGALGPGAPPALRFYLPQRPGEEWDDADVLEFMPQVNEAAFLLTGSLMAAGPTREGLLEAMWSCGRFDEHGDTRERRCGVWRYDGGRPRGFATAEAPA